MRGWLAVLLVGCTAQQVSVASVGPACPGQETAPPALPPVAMEPTACTIGAYERAASVDDAIPLTEDAALAAQQPAQTTLADQIALVKSALEADAAGNYPLCIQLDKKALAISDSGRTRLHLAACERRAFKLVDALKDSQKALEIGVGSKDVPLMQLARKRVKELLVLVPHVRFVEPPGTEIRNLSFDDRQVLRETLAKTFSIDPGHHTLTLEGTESGRLFQRTCTIEVAESTVLPVLLSAR